MKSVLSLILLLPSFLLATELELPNIVLIGYWPPTNDLVRPFSQNEDQNPDGWKGHNWNNLGYNVISYFPEFDQSLGAGLGDFTVDYHGTSKDFWRIVPPLKPNILLSFGRSGKNNNWEIEMSTRNLCEWRPDYVEPLYPALSPPDATAPEDYIRKSEMALDKLLPRLQMEVPGLNIFADDQGAGAFLCEYLGYHLNWYRALHPEQTFFSAHTHIGQLTKFADLEVALNVTLEVLIEETERIKGASGN